MVLMNMVVVIGVKDRVNPKEVMVKMIIVMTMTHHHH